MGVVCAVRRVLLKAPAHPVVGIPQALTHIDTMTHAGNATWPGHDYHRSAGVLPRRACLRYTADDQDLLVVPRRGRAIAVLGIGAIVRDLYRIACNPQATTSVQVMVKPSTTGIGSTLPGKC